MLENLYATDDGARARDLCAASLLVAGGGFDEAARADERRAFLLLLSFFSFFLNSSRKVRERAFPSVEVFTREREREREREKGNLFFRLHSKEHSSMVFGLILALIKAKPGLVVGAVLIRWSVS